MRIRQSFLIVGILAAGSSSCEKSPTQISAPPKLTFVAQPITTVDGQTLPAIQVAVQDASGSTLTGSTDLVTIALGPNSGSATLSGTLSVAAVNGIATFSDLRVSRPGAGYTLTARSPRLTGATSDPFGIALAFAAVSLGERHSCGITVAGQGYCWGENAYGKLGYSPTDFQQQLAPVPVTGALTFVAVNAGFLHSCALTGSGAAYCWGHNGVGEIGDGSTTDRSIPTAVAGGLVFTSLTATSGDHTCGLTITGTAYCWGSNASGKLGDGTTLNRTTPVAVTGGLTFAMLSAGAYHTCGVTTAGAAYCWGYNHNGQLGDGSTTNRSSPVTVLGGHTFASVTVGAWHTCGLTTTAAAYCWGYNFYGQLGNPSVLDQSTPQAVAIVSFVSLSAGAWHTCGVATDNSILCWGQDADGELGDGARTSRWQPAPVRAFVGEGGGHPKVSAGAFHTCATTERYETYCWGYNNEGELGDGTTALRVVPVRVAPPR